MSDPDMTPDATEVRRNAGWRLAVWGLRVAGLGLAVVVGGLIIQLSAAGVGLWMLAVGMGIYLPAVVTVFAGLIPAIRAMPRPRPSFWRVRRVLVQDAVHALP